MVGVCYRLRMGAVSAARMETFLVVARLSSIRRAATQLHITEAAVSAPDNRPRMRIRVSATPAPAASPASLPIG